MAPELLVVGAIFLAISIYAAVRAARNGDGGWMVGITRLVGGDHLPAARQATGGIKLTQYP